MSERPPKRRRIESTPIQTDLDNSTPSLHLTRRRISLLVATYVSLPGVLSCPHHVARRKLAADVRRHMKRILESLPDVEDVITSYLQRFLRNGRVSTELRSLRWHLNSITPLLTLRKLLQEFCELKSRNLRRMSRQACVEALVEKFWSGTNLQERREEEKKYLSLQERLGHPELQKGVFQMCGKAVPREIMREILSYLWRCSRLIATVGLVCFDWYALVLSTWDDVRVTKKMLYAVPVTVIKFAERVRVVNLQNDVWNPRISHSFTMGEYKHIWTSFHDGGRRRSRELVVTFFKLPSVVKFCSSLVRHKGIFESLTRLQFEYLATHKWSSRLSKTDLGTRPEEMLGKSEVADFRLVSVAPNLRRVEGVLFVHWCLGLDRLEELTVFVLDSLNPSFLRELSRFRSLKSLTLKKRFETFSVTIPEESCEIIASFLPRLQEFRVVSFADATVFSRIVHRVGHPCSGMSTFEIRVPRLGHIESGLLHTVFKSSGADLSRLFPTLRELDVDTLPMDDQQFLIDALQGSLQKVSVGFPTLNFYLRIEGDHAGIRQLQSLLAKTTSLTTVWCASLNKEHELSWR